MAKQTVNALASCHRVLEVWSSNSGPAESDIGYNRSVTASTSMKKAVLLPT